MSTSFLIYTIVRLIVGIGLIVSGVKLRRKSENQANALAVYGVQTTATVTEIDRESSSHMTSEGHRVANAVCVVFTTAQGVRIQGTIDYPSIYIEVGSEIQILYDPYNPEHFIEAPVTDAADYTMMGNKIMITMQKALGCLPIVIGAFLCILSIVMLMLAALGSVQ